MCILVTQLRRLYNLGNCRRAHPKYIRISTNSPPYKKMELRKTWESLKVLSEVAVVVVVVVPLAGKDTKSSSVASSRRSSKWRTMVHVVVYCCLPASFYFSAFLCLARCWTEMTVILMFACLSAELLYDGPCEKNRQPLSLTCSCSNSYQSSCLLA